jgi:hypothetical protein
LCSFKQEKKIFTFFFLSLFSPTYFWVPMLCPSVLTSSSDHSPSLEAIQHRLANKHTTTSAGPMMIFCCCCLSCPECFPRLEYKMRCLSLFSLLQKSYRFFFFFLSLVFTFPIFSYHFDDMSKTNSGQPPPPQRKSLCIK